MPRVKQPPRQPGAVTWPIRPDLIPVAQACRARQLSRFRADPLAGVDLPQTDRGLIAQVLTVALTTEIGFVPDGPNID